MSTTVGAVDVVLKALVGDFRKDVAKEATAAGDEAGTKAGSAFGKRFGALAKGAVAAGLAGAFAIATKGALELDTATRKVAASAGIAESEMGAFRSQVTDLFKSNPSKGFEEIAATIGALKTELGLSTEEAGKAAQAFLDFSKVTGQDGASAVKALDDVLDAYNLKAADSQRVMDLLVASHQKFGGSVTANQAALAAMAPSLLALNAGLDDGVALLNLFAASGLDSGAAAAALKKAVDGLKPGESLDSLIAQIAAIEDPTLRAQKAIDIFGAKGGVGLANAFRPGVDSLDAFKLKTEETAGAVTKGADIIDDSFSNKITGAIRTFIEGPLAEMGADAGPVVTALGGLSSLTIAVGGLGKVFDALKVSAALGWAAAVAVPIAPAAALEAIKNPINDLLTGLFGLGDAFGRVQQGFGLFGGGARQAASEAAALEQEARNATRGFSTLGGAAADAAAATAAAAKDQLASSVEMAVALPEAIREQIGPTKDAGLDQLNAYTQGIESGRSGFIDALIGLEKALKTSLTAQQRMSLIAGVLTSKSVAKGMNDARPDVRDRARAVALEALNQLIALGGPAGLAGTAAGQQFAASFGAGAGMTGTFNAAAVTTQQIVNSLSGAFAAGGIKITEYTGDIEGLQKEFLGLGGSAEKAAGGTKKQGDAAADAKKKNEALVDTIKGRLAGAFDALRDVAGRAMDRIHDKNVRAIEDARKLAKATNDARLDAAIASQDAVELARQERDLNEELAQAQAEAATAAPEDQAGAARRVRSATEALQSFNARADIATVRAEVEAANAGIDATADAALAKEDARAAREKLLFEAELVRLEKQLGDVKGKHAGAHAELMALYATYGLDYLAAGENLGQSFADGLASKAAAVEAAATALAEAANNPLKTGSPAKTGPWHDVSPEQMGAAFVQKIADGMLGAAPALQRGIEASLPTFYAAPSLAPTVGGSVQRAASSRTQNITINNPIPEPVGPTISRLHLIAAGLAG